MHRIRRPDCALVPTVVEAESRSKALKCHGQFKNYRASKHLELDPVLPPLRVGVPQRGIFFQLVVDWKTTVAATDLTGCVCVPKRAGQIVPRKASGFAQQTPFRTPMQEF